MNFTRINMNFNVGFKLFKLTGYWFNCVFCLEIKKKKVKGIKNGKNDTKYGFIYCGQRE